MFCDMHISLLLQFLELLFRTLNHRAWYTCKLCHLNSITLVCRARLHRVQKNNFIAMLSRIEMHILHRGDFICECGQFKIMGSEQGECTNALRKIMCTSPCE